MKLKGPRGAWGLASPSGWIQTKFAGPVSVLAHEIGHILGFRYKLFDWLNTPQSTRTVTKGAKKGQQVATKEAIAHRKVISAELRALADLRYEGKEVSAGFARYVRKGAEKEAVLLEALIHAPQKFKEAAPTVYKMFTKFIEDHSELSELMNVNPSLVLGSSKGKIDVPGLRTLGEWWFPEPIARLLNNHLAPGLRGSDIALVRKGYGAVRSVGNLMNMVNLTLSGFHAVNTALDTMNTYMGVGMREIAIGRPVAGAVKIAMGATALPAVGATLWHGNELMKQSKQDLNDIEDPHVRQMLEALIAAGGRSKTGEFWLLGGASSVQGAWTELMESEGLKKIFAAAKIPFSAVGAAAQFVSYPLMQWWVPRLKLGSFYLMAGHEMERLGTSEATDPKLWRMLTQVQDSIDNRLGQLVYDNLFWHKTFKDAMLVLFRSTGWNLGFFREYAGAPVDIFTTGKRVKEGDIWLSHKMGYVAGAVISTMVLGAVLSYLLTGEPPEDFKDYIFVKTGKKNADGTDERIILPTYMKDIYAWTHRPGKTFSNKLHPLWSAIAQTLQNEDFYGTEIRHVGDPVMRQLKDVALYVGEQFLPFSVRNYQQQRKAGASVGRAASGFAGMISAPGYITKTRAYELAMTYWVATLPRGKRTKEQFERSRMRKDLVLKLRRGEDIRSDPNYKSMSRRSQSMVRAEAKTEALAHIVKRLSAEQALNVYVIATPEERAFLYSIVKDKYGRVEPRSGDHFEAVKSLFEEATKLEKKGTPNSQTGDTRHW